MTEIFALQVNDHDNVATIFSNEATADSTVSVRDKKGNTHPLKILGDIPYGHKVAIIPIDKGTPVIKYGEEIGVATAHILPGDYVHVHNCDSQRGRGDLEKEENK